MTIRFSISVAITTWALCGAISPAAAQVGACSKQALHAALLEHDKSRIEFQYKMMTGYIRSAKRGDLAVSADRNKPLYQGADATIKAIAAHLTALDASRRTSALIYALKDSGCVWMVGPDGRVVAGDGSWRATTAAVVRDHLGVTAMVATRGPQLRAALSVALPSPDHLPPIARVGVAEESRNLLPPQIRNAIASGVHTLLILPSTELGAVPFAALAVGERALVETTATITLPSLDGLFFWVKAAPLRRGMAAVVVGNPDFSADTHWTFQALPGAQREAEAVGRMLGTQPMTGQAATPDAVMRRIQSTTPALLHFATHGIADATNPMDDSFLALSGGRLRAAEIKKLAFHTTHPLVIMSACQSGLGKVFNGGVFGLARAWIQAGAAQVLASHWNVDDAATSTLVEATLQKVLVGASTHQALRAAMIEAKERSNDNPALWSAFSLFGYPQPDGAAAAR